MEFTSSFDISVKDKMKLPNSSWYGTTTTLTSLDGETVQKHIDNTIGTNWDFGDTCSLPIAKHNVYENINVLMFVNILEPGSKSVILFDPDNERFYISYSSTQSFLRTDVLRYFNLTIDDELDNYKYTDEILNDNHRASNSVVRVEYKKPYNHIQNQISIYYTNRATELAIIVSNKIKKMYGVIITILAIDSGNETDANYNGETYAINYTYVYCDEELISIKLTCDDVNFYKDEISIEVDNEMRYVYGQIMQSNYLLSTFIIETTLTDEAKAHNENWHDAI